MKRIFFIINAFILISSSVVFAQSTDAAQESQNKAGSDSIEAFAIIPELEAEETENFAVGRNRVIFKTNVKNCKIFLNGNFQGLSQLTLSNVIEGYYLLRVEKDGYEYQENFVYVEREKAKTFYIELQPSEETQKRENARAERAAAREAEKSAKAESTATVQEEEQSAPSESSGIGDAK